MHRPFVLNAADFLRFCALKSPVLQTNILPTWKAHRVRHADPLLYRTTSGCVENIETGLGVGMLRVRAVITTRDCPLWRAAYRQLIAGVGSCPRPVRKNHRLCARGGRAQAARELRTCRLTGGQNGRIGGAWLLADAGNGRSGRVHVGNGFGDWVWHWCERHVGGSLPGCANGRAGFVYPHRTAHTEGLFTLRVDRLWRPCFFCRGGKVPCLRKDFGGKIQVHQRHLCWDLAARDGLWVPVWPYVKLLAHNINPTALSALPPPPPALLRTWTNRKVY